MLQRWHEAYDVSGAVRPECWKEGLLKPDGHTVSVSDLFFIAHWLRMMDVQLGEVDHLEDYGVVTAAGQRISAEVVVKAVGFEPNAGNARLVGQTRMRSIGLVDENLWCHVEPHFDKNALANALA